MKSCFFIGHREASEEIFSALTEAVEHHIVDFGVPSSVPKHTHTSVLSSG